MKILKCSVISKLAKKLVYTLSKYMFGNPGNVLAIIFQADIQNQVFLTLLIDDIVKDVVSPRQKKRKKII